MIDAATFQRARTTSIGSKWMTAGVLERSVAKRFIGRLDDVGIECRVVADDEGLRVLVPYRYLDDAIDLRPETNDASLQHRARFQPGYRCKLRLLVTLPLGAAIGSAYALSSSVQWPDSHLVSAISAVVLALIVEVVCSKHSQPDYPTD